MFVINDLSNQDSGKQDRGKLASKFQGPIILLVKCISIGSWGQNVCQVTFVFVLLTPVSMDSLATRRTETIV
jgi:hypothetical protein